MEQLKQDTTVRLPCTSDEIAGRLQRAGIGVERVSPLGGEIRATLPKGTVVVHRRNTSHWMLPNGAELLYAAGDPTEGVLLVETADSAHNRRTARVFLAAAGATNPPFGTASVPGGEAAWKEVREIAAGSRDYPTYPILARVGEQTFQLR